MSNTPEPNPNFRAGMVAVLGRTNAGKSTLVNALVGRKVSIVTPKPQTTREAVQGVVHRPEGQIVFVDTPGFFKTHASALVDKLHQRARRALDGIDAILHVVDPTKEIGEEEEMVVAVLANVPQAKILCLSKSDLEHRPASEAWRARATGYKAVIDKTDTHDFHATLLHLLGFDHEKLTHMHNGRRYRLTDVLGKVIKPVLA